MLHTFTRSHRLDFMPNGIDAFRSVAAQPVPGGLPFKIVQCHDLEDLFKLLPAGNPLPLKVDQHARMRMRRQLRSDVNGRS